MSHLFPHCSPLPHLLPTLPQSVPTLLSVPVSPLLMFLDLPLPLLSLFSLSPLPSSHCQFVLYFHVSCSVLLISLFCWLGSSYRWDHTVLLEELKYLTQVNKIQVRTLYWMAKHNKKVQIILSLIIAVNFIKGYIYVCIYVHIYIYIYNLLGYTNDYKIVYSYFQSLFYFGKITS